MSNQEETDVSSPISPETTMLIKIVLVGDTGVGKTAILSKFIHKEFLEDHFETVGVEFSSTSLQLKDNVRANLRIWDTSGNPHFHSIINSFFKSATSIFFVFDISNRESFKSLDSWIIKAKGLAHPKTVFVLIGNQSDKAERAVKFEEGLQAIKSHGVHFYFEVSAKTGANIELIFAEATSLMFLQFNNIQVSSDYRIPPSPIILGKSLVFFLIGVFCFLWISLTSSSIKAESLMFSHFWGFCEHLFNQMNFFWLERSQRKKEEKEYSSFALRKPKKIHYSQISSMVLFFPIGFHLVFEIICSHFLFRILLFPFMIALESKIYKFFYLTLYGNMVPWHQIQSASFEYKEFLRPKEKSSKLIPYIFWFSAGILFAYISPYLKDFIIIKDIAQ